MDTLGRLAALCLLALLAAPLMREGGLGLLAPLAALLAGALLLLAAARELGGTAERIVSLSRIPAALFSPLLKAVLIGLVTRLAGALCADAGQSALKALLDIGGTLCALLAALPLVSAFLDLLEGWL